MARGLLICIVGIDGSGKTTLAKSVVGLLNSKGFQFTYIHNRYNPLILRPFIFTARKLFLRNTDVYTDYSEDSNAKRSLLKHRGINRFYQLLLACDYYVQTVFTIIAPVRRGKNIVCDRYILDTVCTDLAVDLSYNKDETEKVLKQCYHFFPEPDLTFLIDIPEEVAYARKTDTPSVSYLKDRRHIYLNLCDSFPVVQLDGLMSKQELEMTVQNLILEKIKCF